MSREDRGRLERALEEATVREAKLRHAMRFSPSPKRLHADDPLRKAEAEVADGRAALRSLEELDEGGHSRN